MATPRKSWPKGAEADRVGAIDSQKNILDCVTDARTLVQDARHALAWQDWRLLEMVLIKLDSDMRAEAMSTILALEIAKREG